MLMDSGDKTSRILHIMELLNKGEKISKKQLALDIGVSEKSIQRDINDIKTYYLNNAEMSVSLSYDTREHTYSLVRDERDWFTCEEILSVCKILLESRGLNKGEMELLLKKLLNQVPSAQKKIVKAVLQNEEFCYIEPQHGKRLFSTLWNFSEYIAVQRIIEIEYKRYDFTVKKHRIKPVALMFSEYYFYIIAYMDSGERDYLVTFRVDRIEKYSATEEKFSIPYKDKFNYGEFRKRVQFMQGGKLLRVKFFFKGKNIEPLVDRLPTAKIIAQEESGYYMSAEAYGEGLKMWLNMQSENISQIEYY